MKIARFMLRSPGGLMTLIVALAVLMAFYVEHRRRKIELDTRLSLILLDLACAAKEQPSASGTSSNSEYFEYGPVVEEVQMIDKPMNPPPRPGRRWTLGGLMLLVALSALPMTWCVHNVREAARQRTETEARRRAAVAHAWALSAGQKGNHR